MPYSSPSVAADHTSSYHLRTYDDQNAFALMNKIAYRGQSSNKFHVHPVSESDGDDSDAFSEDTSDTSAVPLTRLGIPFPSHTTASTRTSCLPCPVSARADHKPLPSSLKSFIAPRQLPALAHTPSNPANITHQPCAPDQPHKNVHFEDDANLTTVRLFRITGKPKSISLREDETETETDTCDEPFAFHLASNPRFSLAPPPLSSQVPRTPPNPSVVPLTHPATHPTAQHILLTSLALTGKGDDGSPRLSGGLLVRNITYKKNVTVRFTLDNWRTTSEITAHYLSPGVLPPQWHDDDFPYDAFRFCIALHGLPRCTLFLAARLLADGGEWWDNNGGENYTVTFRPALLPRRSRSSLPTHHRYNYASTTPNTGPNTPLDIITRGTGFSSLALPSTPPPTPVEQHHSRLTLRNSAHAKPWQTPPYVTKMRSPATKVRSLAMQRHALGPTQLNLIGGHPETVSIAGAHEVGAGICVPVLEGNGEKIIPTVEGPASPRASSPVKVEGDHAPISADTYSTLLARWCFATSASLQDEFHGSSSTLNDAILDSSTRPAAVGFV